MSFGIRRLYGYWATGAILVWVAVCVGCGGRDLVTVEGEVTFDGEPVENGSIVFEPADAAGTSAGGIIENGAYRLADATGVPPGEKIVRITAIRKTGRQITASESGGPGEAATGPTIETEETERYIPSIYNEDSTLTCEIVPGEVNQHDFHLESQQ